MNDKQLPYCKPEVGSGDRSCEVGLGGDWGERRKDSLHNGHVGATTASTFPDLHALSELGRTLADSRSLYLDSSRRVPMVGASKHRFQD